MSETTTEKTSSHYLYSGNTVRAMAAADLVTTRRLATATYEVIFDPDRGYYLNKIDDMVVPSMVFGDTKEFADRVVKTFQDRGCNTGVLLEGEQGSGKTMLAKLVSSLLRDLDMPTIVINQAFTGPAFNAFMAAIDTPCMVFFDEFEKTYSKMEDKEKILTFFDGVFDSNKLIICTVNDKSRMSTHMLNRPGRLFYAMSYTRLSQDVIKQYCEMTLNDKMQIPAICRVTSLYGGFNFDMLKALVEEMNRFKCSPKEALKFLNIRPSFTRFKSGTSFIPVGYKEGTKKMFISDKAMTPPTEDSGTSLTYSSKDMDDETEAAVMRLVNAGTYSRQDMVKIIVESVNGRGDNDRWSDRVYVSADDLLSYDPESGSQLYAANEAIIRFIPVSDEELKAVSLEAKEVIAAAANAIANASARADAIKNSLDDEEEAVIAETIAGLQIAAKGTGEDATVAKEMLEAAKQEGMI